MFFYIVHNIISSSFIVRDFSFKASARGDSERLKAELKVEVDRLWSGLLRWCRAHFGEAFIAWMHIKAIRVFVESVLRYGLPVNFAVVLVRVRDFLYFCIFIN